MIHLYLLPLLLFDFAGIAFDVYETKVGLKKGAGIEGNPIINFLSGATPKTWALIAVPVVAALALLGLSLTGLPALIGASIGGLVADGASHIQAGVKWKFLNSGGQIDRQKPYTWWQKLLGMGWD